MPGLSVNLRPATKADIDAVNRVIESAIMTWQLPERVKRLSLSSYQYTAIDFNHFEIVVAETDSHEIIGIAAWEKADVKNASAEYSALLLHSIYVDSAYHHQGVGHALFQAAENAAINQNYEGLLVKAQEGANNFFISEGMERLPTDDSHQQYANRFWKKIAK
ncbi:MAG: GNAT family N-acetyltransferase [Gammaproteobacteria bacterium]|nr:GNAT family N-acetyltransferase [Gammaproteobacteria bacterium]